MSCEVSHQGRIDPLPEDLRVVLFQAVRELLINVVKHAGARRVNIGISKGRNKISITLEDDGTGFDPARTKERSPQDAGFGHINLRERLEFLGGGLDIRSRPGHGTQASIDLPLRKKGRS